MDWGTAAQAFASVTGLIGGVAGIVALVRWFYAQGMSDQKLQGLERRVDSMSSDIVEARKMRDKDNAEIHGRISTLQNNLISWLHQRSGD